MTYTEGPDELIRLPIKHIIGHMPRGCICVFYLIDTIWTNYAGAESTLGVKWGSQRRGAGGESHFHITSE